MEDTAFRTCRKKGTLKSQHQFTLITILYANFISFWEIFLQTPIVCHVASRTKFELVGSVCVEVEKAVRDRQQDRIVMQEGAYVNVTPQLIFVVGRQTDALVLDAHAMAMIPVAYQEKHVSKGFVSVGTTKAVMESYRGHIATRANMSANALNWLIPVLEKNLSVLMVSA